jgi:hypothetical protein
LPIWSPQVRIRPARNPRADTAMSRLREEHR